MKVFPGLIVAAVCTAASLHAQTLRISDFRIPDSFFERFSVSAEGVFSLSDSERKPPESSGSTMSQSFDFSPLYRLFLSSEQSSHSLFTSLRSNFAYGKSSSLNSPNSVMRRENHSQSWDLTIDWQGSSYFDEGPAYWYGSLNGNGRYSRHEAHQELSDSVTVFKSDEREKFRSYDATAGAGFGVGRIRDGLPIISILRILDRLREDNVLIREPDRDEVLHLVRTYARLSEYQGNRERYSKYFFGDLFAAMESMGIVQRSGLAAYSIVRTLEVLTEYHAPRLFGWRIQAGLEHHSTQYEDFSTLSYRRFKDAADYLKLMGEAGHDLSLEAHAYARGDIRAGLFYQAVRFAEFQGSGMLTYDLGERIETQASVTYTRYHSWRDGGSLPHPAIQRTSVQVHFNVRFYIEDRVTLYLRSSYSLRRQNQNYIYPFGRTLAENGAYTSIGLNYRFF